jgi:flagellar biosynthesis protein FliQ
MPPRPNFRQYLVPVIGLLWGLCMSLAGLISQVQDMTSQFSRFPFVPYMLLALPGFLAAAGWLLVRIVK